MEQRDAKWTVGEIYRDLRERICLLDIEPGERLREVALANDYGVSRTPVRQVLDRLEHDRLVVQRPGQGASVAIVDTKEIRDVWAVRLKLGELLGDFVRLPAPQHVIGQVVEVGGELDLIRESRDLRALGALYNRYHEIMLQVFSSDTLRRIHDQLYHQTARVWLQFLPEMDLDAEIDIMADEVEQTTAALQGSSGQRLAEVRARHMRMLVDRFNQHVARPLG